MAKLNPFKFSDLKHHAIPFEAINEAEFIPELKSAIADSKQEIQRIENNPEPPNFENTILAMETCGDRVDLISSIFFNLLGANTNERMQALAAEMGPMLSSYSSDIQLSDLLFDRIKKVYEQKNSQSPEEQELIEKYYSNFARNGALLNPSDKNQLREWDSELSKLGPDFSERVLKATNEFSMLLEKPEEIAGLPKTYLESARIAAQEKGHSSGWLITLQAPSYVPFMQFAEHRASREKLYRAYGSRAFNDTYDNQKNVLRFVKLREKRARLLGYKNHADFVLEKRMAENPDKVFHFLERLKDAALRTARKEVAEVKTFAIQNGGPSDFQAWDFSFWSEKLKENTFHFKAEDLKPYFRIENVISGVFKHAELLYGLDFRKSSDYPVYHPDVTTYEVYDKDTKEFVGLFYTDFFPRPSKNGGAWMTNFYEQGLYNGAIHRPHVAIVCNFTKPTPQTPSLLTFDEVSTLFHEFGHALHSLLSQCTFRSLAGTNVYWDFVELPSQIMENWILEKESLDLFAVHYETGEPIPQDLAKKIKASALFQAGYATLRQVMFAWLDMKWHTIDFSEIKNVMDFENDQLQSMRIIPPVSGTNLSCGFSHIFSGGYSAGYYSYKWAEVLDADAFALFKQKGLFDKETAQLFRRYILSKGGTEHPMALYKKFRGREPDPDCLLKRDGLL